MLDGNQKQKLGKQMNIIILFACILYSCTENAASNNNSFSHKKEVEISSIIKADTNHQNEYFDQINLYEKRLITVLKTGRTDWIVTKGKSCQYCDENISVYIYPFGNENVDSSFVGGSYNCPGKMYAYEDESMVYQAKGYYGKGIKKKEVPLIVLVQKELSYENEWVESVFLLEFYEKSLKETLIMDPTEISEIKRQIVSLIAQDKLTEIEGIEQTLTP